jgi:hypothetical protein
LNRPEAVALFVAAAAGSAALHLATRQARRRRERAQRDLPVDWNVPLREPLWSRGGDAAPFVAVAAGVAAGAAALGFAGVGVGIVATVVLLIAWMAWFTDFATIRSLTFTAEGLRVQKRRAAFLVRWENIDGVERTGANDHVVQIEVRSAQDVLASVRPQTARALRYVSFSLADREGPTATISLAEWTAGLAPSTLARALRDGVARRARAAAN